jgi:hypothetical protein
MNKIGNIDVFLKVRNFDDHFSLTLIYHNVGVVGFN